MSDTFGFTTTDMPPAVLGPRVRLGGDRVNDHAVHLGDQDTAVLIVEGSLFDLRAYFTGVVDLLHARIKAEAVAGRNYREFFPVDREGHVRGGYSLDRQSAKLGYDEDAALIWQHLGGTVRAYRRTPDEVEQSLRDPWTSAYGTTRRSEYLVGWPGDEDEGAPLDVDEPESVWRRFDDHDALSAWLSAYQLEVDAEPIAGEFFDIALPQDTTGFQPLS